MNKRKLGKSLLTVILSVLMVIEMIVPCFTAFAAEIGKYEGGAGTKISDLDTSTKYSESLGDNASTEYAGRIWTDKSVYTDDVTFATYGGGESTIKLNEAKNGEDFLVAYSALATSESVLGQTQAPVDVVFIIDISGSMSNSNSEMDNGLSRIANTVVAVNNSIEKIMGMNEHTRISVVTFSNTAEVLLPLDHYTKMSNNNTTYNYLSLNSTEAGGSVELTARAVGSLKNRITKERDVTGGTNIQAGIYTGMNVLEDEENTTADINGQAVTRIPSVVLLSDGAPTYSSDSRNWWEPGNNDDDGPGSSSYYGNGFKALITGAYMKNAIDENYEIAGTNYATTFYTIGMGISELDNYERNFLGQTYYTGEQDLAYFTLDPKTYWTETNDMAEAMVDAWEDYTDQTPNGSGTVSVKVSSSGNYTVRHPQSPLSDIYTTTDKDALKNLVDSYYDADNASAVNSVFDQIISNISISAPQVPTEIEGTDHTKSGFITYTDPIGEYMEVKDVKAIIYAGQTFTAKSTATVGNKTTYTFSGTVESAVYGHQEIADITITVEETNGKQTLVIKIPASVIPLRVNEVSLNADGTVKTHTNNGAFPARVIYSVGLQDEVVKESNDGTFYIDRSKISSEYLSANTNEDGTVNFYSNVYSNINKVNDATAGDATVEFEPSHSNGFYYILDEMPIYKDAEFKQQVRSTGDLDIDLDDDTVYYYRDEYYHGSSVEVDAIERTGVQLKSTAVKVGEDGYLYRASGSPRLNRILKFEGTKVKNATKTAEDFYAPTFQYKDGSSDAYEGKFVIYQGNNGVISVVGGGNLQISKTVNAGIGLTAPDKSFEFTIDLDGDEVNQGEYDYIIVNAQGETVGTGTVSETSSKISLKGGQTATILSLPPETTYTVTETAVDGFTTESEGTTGTIAAGQTSVANFTNTYNVTPITYPTGTSIKGTKVLERPGNEWTQDDVFTFFISPYNNAPLPVDYDVDTGVVVDGPDDEGGNIATFDFGSINFTAPGTYRYTIVEKEPENEEYLPGMSYSRALYRVVVTVVDNGDGTLSVTSSDIQKLYDDEANQLFTYVDGQIVMNQGQEGQDEIKFVNSYNAESVTRVPVALKDYTDNSGKNPLVSGMFEFKLEALGVVDVQNDSDLSDDPLKPDTASGIPMPNGQKGGSVTTKNEGHNVTFPSVTFTQDDIPTGETSVTFRYRMSEVIPENKVNGMSYDEKTYDINVIVSVDSQSHILNVSAIYPNDERIVTFKNEYTPISVFADIDGSKTMVGRDIKSDDNFEFVLGSNAATGNAIREGSVVVPSDTATVTVGKNGVASPFAFEDIEFKKAGTYVFTVSETKGDAPSVEYDDSVITVTVVIDDAAKDGNLEVVSITYDNGKSAAEFTNTYTSTFSGDPVNLSGTKNLTGKTLLAGEFYFEIKAFRNGEDIGSGWTTHTVDTTHTNGVYTGSFSILDAQTYTRSGTFEYYISEVIPTNKVTGTTYDESKFRFTVVVEDDLNGNLTVKSTKLEKANGADWETADDVVFNNTYVPNPTTTTLPLINKVVDGDRSEPLKADEFEFEMKVVSANPSDGITLPSNTIVSNAANGNIIFDEITFTKAGTYVVAVQEIEPDEADKSPGITYSSQTITAVYSVVDDRNGKLTATLTQLIGGENIINIYTAEPTDVTIDITKTFTGRKNDEWLTTDKFDFNVKVTDADTLTAIQNGDIEFTFDNASTDTATYTISSKGSKASAAVKVNKPGTYKFVVSEVDGGIKGVTYDKSEKEVVIVATDDSANAKIKVMVNGQDTAKATLDFKNEYKPEATETISFTAKKKVTASVGNSYTLNGGEFSFVIEGTQGAPMPTDTTAENDANGNVSFGTVEYTQRGTYTYTIREAQGSLAGFTYDGEVYTVTVEVTDDYANGKLVAATKITNKAGKDAAVEFENKYEPKETSALIFGNKVLEGGHKQLEADEFEFSIKGITDNAPMPSETTVKNTATGTFQFDTITYTKVGTYKYEISEKDLEENGYTYDDKVYTVTVTVTDEGKGQLNAKVDGVGPVEEPEVVFVNSYVPDAVDVVIGKDGELTKSLEGRDMNENEFVFAVLDSENNEVATAKNTKDGKFQFTLNFTKADTYNYTIVEKDNEVAGITYDKNVYGVEIIVVDKGGYLEVSSVDYTLEDKAVEKVVFSNTYDAADVDISLSATKKLLGRDLVDGEFKFVLLDENGNVISTATNTKDGKIVFDKIVFTEAGTYKYRIYEENGTIENVTYDKTEYIIEIKVTDEGKGKLAVSTPVIKKSGSDEKIEAIIFENVFTAPTLPEVPQTGDNFNLALWLALMFVSGICLIGSVVYSKRIKTSKH